MTKRAWITCLAALAVCSEAGAITFTNAQFDVTAIAVTSGPAGFDSQSSPPSATPVSASADSLGGADIATAGAIAGPGLLTSSADVSGGGGGAINAVATSHFTGSFVSSAAEPYLVIGFTPLGFAVGSGLAATSLFVSLTSGGTTLFQGFIDGSSWTYNLAPGTAGLLDLTLSSEVSAGFPAQGVGNASSFGQATITSAVPLPAPWLLLLVGMGPLAARRARAKRFRQVA